MSSDSNAAGQRWWLVARLLQRVLSVCAVVWFASTLYILFFGYAEGQRNLDHSLESTAELVLAYADHELTESHSGLETVIVSERVHNAGYLFQMWTKDGVLLARSAQLPPLPMTKAMRGFENVQIDGQGWRVYVVWNDDASACLQLAQRDTVRTDVIRQIVLSLIIPAALGGPLLGVLIWIVVRRAMAPVSQAAAELACRNLSDLRPILAGQLPGELSPLVVAFNNLLERLGRAVEAERRFTADAAHELRTPLAAIRLQAQLAQRATAREDATRALERLIDGVDRATRLIEQLLTLARFDPDGALEAYSGVAPLQDVVLDVIIELEPQARERDIELRSRYRGQLIRVPAEATRILVRNLVENAIRYSPQQRVVQVAAALEGQHWLVEVQDDGPGIPEGQRERVFERFVRLQRGREGSGLGLSIVRRIAQLLQGTLDVCSGPDGRGTLIRFTVPLQR